jgi:hypothetical protein
MAAKEPSTGQTVIAVVWDPDTVLEVIGANVDALRAWAAESGGKTPSTL